MSSCIIKEWDTSYYCWTDRIWKYGKLAVCSNCICFIENGGSKMDDKTVPLISLEMRRICAFQRKYVSFLFKAIVINVERARPQWFSSLKNREETYFYLEHFWQQQQLGLWQSNFQKFPLPLSGVCHAKRRQKLFEVLYDSEETLIGAASSLHHQGEQMDHSSHVMNTMHTDLNVAETLINGLDRWLTKWDIKPEYFYQIDIKKDFPVLYRKSSKENFGPGSLIVKQDQLTVLNIKKVVVLNLLLKDLTNIIVTTPWDITLIRSVIGETNTVVEISSAHVVYIIKALQYEHGDKLEYEESPSHTKRVVNFGDESKSYHILPAAASLDDQVQGVELPEPVNLQVEQQQKTLSDVDKADLDKVSGVVENMKSLATGIGQEMNRQLDRLDEVSESVDKANYRIREDNRKLQDKV